MHRIPVEEFNLPGLQDDDVINAWKWFLSFISEKEWQKRKASIEKRVAVEFKSTPSSETQVLTVKDDLISWYLYLIDMIINEPHKYEYFQGARVLPIFQRLGADLGKLKEIEGVEKRIKDLMWKRQSEADAILFEILTALLWARNDFKVAFTDEKVNGKTPDIIAKKGNGTWNIECKRQSKTADYTYRETAKRQKMISLVGIELLKRNILLDITFHVELETLPDTFLKDILLEKLLKPVPGNIVSNEQVDINLDFVDIPAIKHHLEKYFVKHNSPLLNTLIGRKPIDNKAFTCSVYGNFFRVGEGEVNNLFMSDIERAFGVYWSCDAKEAVWAKARDIKNQVRAAIQQFSSEDTAVIHVGMETFEGPQVEKARFEKIRNTVSNVDTEGTNLQWIFCHFFQAYSPPDEVWVFDETTSSMARNPATPPLTKRLMIVPDDGDTAEEIYHWDRPLP